jgi:uncharacterized protein (DUF1015 family)
MTIFPFTASYPQLDKIKDISFFVEDVREDYKHYKESIFKTHDTAAIFLYVIETPLRKHWGIISTMAIADYVDGKIQKHENTIESKEKQQGQLLLERKAIVKPVLLTYTEVDEISEAIFALTENILPISTIDFETEKQIHKIWKVDAPNDVQKLQDLFKTHVPLVYIADGHHRIEASKWLHEWGKEDATLPRHDAFLCALFSSDALEICAFHRNVHFGGTMSEADFLTRIAEYADITKIEKPIFPRHKFELGLYISNEYYILNWKKEYLQTIDNQSVALDVNFLNQYIFKNILGIENIRADKRISYLEGPLKLKDIIHKKTQRAGEAVLLMYPVALPDLMAIADAGQVMPPKSTWFEPRMRNGLLVQDI